MAKRKMDIGLGNHRRLVIVNGDFVIVESTGEHQVQLLLNGKGDFKDNPTIGVGVLDYINDEDIKDLPGVVSQQYTQDGMEVKSVTMSVTGIINSDAYYK